MNTAMVILFWGLLFLLIYTYFGYPLMLMLLERFQRLRESGRETEAELLDGQTGWPVVSLLVPAFNEQSVIRQKIENCLALDYPADQLEIVIASDGSTDETNEMVAAYGENEIRFLHCPRRKGKTNVINSVVPALRGEIVVLTDSSAILELQALKKIVRRLRKPDIGAASGIYKFRNVDNTMRGKGEYLYWKYETRLKILEDRTGSVIGAHGALLAFKKELFRPLPPNAINDDFIIPMQILEQGYRVAYVTEARAEEETYGDSFADYHRRSRIFVGNLQQIFILKGMLNPLKGLNMWKFLSHKVLRTFSPLFVVLLLLVNLFLTHGIYGLFLLGQAGFYSFVFAGLLFRRLLGATKCSSFAYYFIFGHVAALVGYFKFLFRQQQITWNRG